MVISTLAWGALAELRDPELSCHSTLVHLSDTIWGGIFYQTFLAGKMWLLFTLCVFVTAQAILRYYQWHTPYQWARFTVFAFRMYIYSCVAGELAITHTRN